MRVDCVDDKIIVYLRDEIDCDLEDLCNQVILDLDRYFKIKLKGFYEVKAYVDKDYGIILEFIIEDLDLYIDFSRVDLHIIKENTKFLYKIEDILDIDIEKFYVYKGNYYITIDNVNNNNIEFGTIEYKTSEEIIKNGDLIIL